MIVPKFIYEEVIKIKSDKAFEDGYRKAINEIIYRIDFMFGNHITIDKVDLIELITKEKLL